ncbi:hypothetical protein ECANGB1_120 [Enterospora canceri]|uniref:Uncharacterized protein n=1 Tax=Enterospora canceri TaxID=1081671 RepID=A0A1Y1S4L1_9MICR|nr:hypothetical protein ECANGB1_120 [Enterospora canceri]
MLVVWSWMFYLLRIQCTEDKAYKLIKAEYDNLEDFKTMNQTKIYRDKVILFPDVTRGSDIVETNVICVDSNTGIVSTMKFTHDDTLIYKAQANILSFVTNPNPDEGYFRECVINFYTNDDTTEEECEEAIKQLKAVAKQKEDEGDISSYFVYEEIVKATIEIGKDGILTADEKQKRLIEYLLQLPTLIPISFLGSDDVNNTGYFFMAFTLKREKMKSEIIKVTRKQGENPIIEILDEYGAATKKNGISKKVKAWIVVIAVIVGVAIISTMVIIRCLI